MAFNNGYPQFYQQYPQFQQQNVPPMQPNMFQQPQSVAPQTQSSQLQSISSGLISIPSEADARNYPVGYGQSVSFRDENAPYLYTKTMGFSQLEPPKFEKYKLIKESADSPEKPLENNQTEKLPTYAEKRDIEDVRAEIEALKERVNKLSEKKKKKEVIVDDDDE